MSNETLKPKSRVGTKDPEYQLPVIKTKWDLVAETLGKDGPDAAAEKYRELYFGSQSAKPDKPSNIPVK